MSGWRKRILIIDDDDETRSYMAEALTMEGYYVAGLDNGLGAIDSIHAQQPDLIILDILMPDVSGVDVLAQIAALKIDIPIIVATALPLTIRELDGYVRLDKPYNIDDLYSTVRTAIGPSERRANERN